MQASKFQLRKTFEYLKKKRISLIVGLIVTTLSVVGFNFRGSYYFVIPIECLNSYQIPCTSIEIEGNKYQVEIDLGSKTAISLDKKVLGKIDKKQCGTSRRIDFRGNEYETSTYFIPKTKVGTLSAKHIKAREESVEFTTKNAIILETKENRCEGRIGRDFFHGKNIFMDFGRYTFIACSQLKNLEKEGYKSKDFLATPFKDTANGIILEIETDLGKQKFIFDTGTSISVIRPQELGADNQKQKNGIPIIETSKFIIDGINFGSRELYLLDITQAFDGIDGILGMDFLKEHPVYLDFAKHTAYIGNALD